MQAAGLGKRFKSEVKATILRIQAGPEIWPTEKGEIRRCLLHKFPFKVLYSIEKDYIYIVAVAHCHRRPEYWIDRLPS